LQKELLFQTKAVIQKRIKIGQVNLSLLVSSIVLFVIFISPDQDNRDLGLASVNIIENREGIVQRVGSL
jgi:hypothetical protein